MFNKSILEKVLAQYKQDFVLTQWKNENYKWKAVKQFQDNWDVNASDFSEMLSRSLEKTYNLLASANNFPKGMMSEFAKAAPEEVRAMFIALFDESRDVFERMDEFKHQSSVLLEKYGNGAAQHYQYENAISTYLWLRYPDKYYIYKFSEVKTVASELESDYQFRKGAYAENIRNFLNLYDEISAALKEDAELVNLLHSHLTDDCYPDPELNARILEAAKRNNITVKPVKVHSSDVFYTEPNVDGYKEISAKHGCACVEMESFALLHNANVLHKKATCMLTISDSMPKNEHATAAERQTSFTDMMTVALEACLDQ